LPFEFGSVSEHITFDVAPVVRLMSAETTRFSKKP
jgi:hypothetical protein